MNRRQLLKGLIAAPIVAVTVSELAREAPVTDFPLVQPKAEGATLAYDPELPIYPWKPYQKAEDLMQFQFHSGGAGSHYGSIYHDGSNMVIENAKTGRKLVI